MTTVYKLTDQNLRTYRGYQWVLGETRTFPGTGGLCGPGWCHAYTHPLLAILLNPIHANIQSPRLFQADALIGQTDHHGLKIGCSTLRLVKELPVPVITMEQRVRFAIFCALAVYSDPSFVTWAEGWLSGTNRTAEAAEVAARVARAATEVAAAGRAWAAAWAARAAEKAVTRAARVARVARRAAAWAAWAAAETAGETGTRHGFNLIEIAEAACAELTA